MKKIKLKSIIAMLLVALISSGISVAAVTLSAKEIGFISTHDDWQVDNVEDAMNDLYDLSSDIIADYSEPRIINISVRETMTGNDVFKTATGKITYNGTVILSATTSMYNYTTSYTGNRSVTSNKYRIPNTDQELHIVVNGKSIGNSMTACYLDLYINDKLVRSYSASAVYSSAGGTSDNWNILGY